MIATDERTAPAPPALRLAGAGKVYGTGPQAVHALRAVDLDLPVGSFTAIMGPSGSGKSTLLQCAAGLDQLTEGEARLDGVDWATVAEPGRTERRRDRVGFVFQTFNLLAALSARENMLLPLRLGGRRPDPRWLAQVVAATDLAERLDHRPAELSGGQQQRVAIARALLTRPAVVFADEPTGALDRRSGAAVLDLLRRCVDTFGQTVVMVTHDPVAAARADRTVILADGRIVDEVHGGDPITIGAQMTALEAEER